MSDKLSERLESAWDKLIEKLDTWLSDAVLMLPNILLALLVMTVTIILSRYVKRGVLKLLKRFSDNQAVNRLIGTLATGLMILIGMFIVLDMLKLDKLVTSLLAGAGVVGLVLGLAFQEPIINTVAGVVLAVRRMYRTGDLIKTNGYFGTVREKTLYYTTMDIPSGQQVVMPNKLIVQNPIENYSTGKRRVELSCGVHYDSDLQQVEDLTLNVVEGIEGVQKDEGIEFFYTEFGDSSINFMTRFWIEEVGQASYYKAQSAVIKNLKSRFDEEGIVIPFPIRTINLDDGATEVLNTRQQKGD